MSTRAIRQAERTNAQIAKASGAGSTATATRGTANSLFGDILGGIGTIIGGPAGGIIGKGVGELGGRLFGGGGDRGGGAALACPPGMVRIGSACVNPPFSGAPGIGFGTVGTSSAPVVVDGGGGAVVGAFGIAARTPVIELREVRECPRGSVLGMDNLCYPKQVLNRRSKFRKWRQPTRPKFSAADMKAIRKAESLVDDVKELNKAVGLRVPSKPKKK